MQTGSPGSSLASCPPIGNLCVALRAHLRGTSYRTFITFITDMTLRVAAGDCYFYPDVIVTCSDDGLSFWKLKT